MSLAWRVRAVGVESGVRAPVLVSIWKASMLEAVSGFSMTYKNSGPWSGLAGVVFWARDAAESISNNSIERRNDAWENVLMTV
jgi:hypothetical protein